MQSKLVKKNRYGPGIPPIRGIQEYRLLELCNESYHRMRAGGPAKSYRTPSSLLWLNVQRHENNSSAPTLGEAPARNMHGILRHIQPHGAPQGHGKAFGTCSIVTPPAIASTSEMPLGFGQIIRTGADCPEPHPK